jgi:hypothetical protein
LATSGPAIEGVVIAVEAGVSGAGTTAGGGGATSGAGGGGGCCANAEAANPKAQTAVTARVAATLGAAVLRTGFISFFPLTQSSGGLRLQPTASNV